MNTFRNSNTSKSIGSNEGVQDYYMTFDKDDENLTISNYTLAILSNDSFQLKDEILRRILQNHLTILKDTYLELSSEQVYDLLSLDGSFDDKCDNKRLLYMSNRPLLVLCLVGFGAVGSWKSIVAEFRDRVPNEHVLFASNGTSAAKNQIEFFFPNVMLDQLDWSWDQNMAYLQQNGVLPILEKGLIEVAKKQPKHPLLFLAKWLSDNYEIQ